MSSNRNSIAGLIASSISWTEVLAPFDSFAEAIGLAGPILVVLMSCLLTAKCFWMLYWRRAQLIAIWQTMRQRNSGSINAIVEILEIFSEIADRPLMSLALKMRHSSWHIVKIFPVKWPRSL